jgi:hypothetical protein
VLLPHGYRYDRRGTRKEVQTLQDEASLTMVKKAGERCRWPSYGHAKGVDSPTGFEWICHDALHAWEIPFEGMVEAA